MSFIRSLSSHQTARLRELCDGRSIAMVLICLGLIRKSTASDIRIPRSRLTTPSVLVFDVNETLIDIESIAPLFGELFGDERVLREWFGQLVMYSMTATLADCYVDFFTLGQGVLHMLADIHRVEITDDDVRRLQEQMRTMPAHPDAVDGTHIPARQRFSSGYADELTAPPRRADATGQRRARRAFSTSSSAWNPVARSNRRHRSTCMRARCSAWRPTIA